MRKPTHVFNGQKLKEIDIHSLRNTKPRVMRSSVTLPSQYQSYAICVQFAKEWFLEKFSDKIAGVVLNKYPATKDHYYSNYYYKAEK